MRTMRSLLMRYRTLWVLIALALWVGLCYGFALQLPFFHDDLPILSWLRDKGWREVWFSQENSYYRPLAFTVYRLGLMLPLGARQLALHAVNLALHWLNAVLVFAIVHLCERRFNRAAIASLLFVAFPFLSEAIPWVTALSHPQVIALTLLAAWAALKAELEGPVWFWALSLAAAAAAPLAHESGVMAGVFVGSGVLLQAGWRSPRRWVLATGGVLLNVAALLGRTLIPGAVVTGSFAGLPDLPANFMFFVHGLLYPVGPFIGAAVQRWGWRDFALIGGSGLALGGVLLFLGLRRREYQWILHALCWWAVGGLPAMLSLRYGAFFVGERLYALATPGTVMLWAGLLDTIGQLFLPKRRYTALLIPMLATALLLTQNFTYIRHKQTLYTHLHTLYQEVLTVAAEPGNAPLGFINLPGALIWQERTYALTTANAVFVPSDYTNLGVFLAVNQGPVAANVATYGPLFQETDPFWLSQGPWLEGVDMRDFLAQHRTNWLARYDEAANRWHLWEVGGVLPTPERAADLAPRAVFEGGVQLLSVNVLLTALPHTYQLTFDWIMEAPLDATVFVHVRESAGNVVAQADGAMASGLLPFWAVHPGDRVRDVRYITLPENAAGPFSVFVGLYRDAERFPAYVDGARVPDDAVLVGHWGSFE